MSPLIGLGVLLLDIGTVLRDRAPHGDDASIEVDVSPSQCAQLASRRRRPTCQPVGPSRLRTNPRSRSPSPARRPCPCPSLDPSHLAVMDRPHPYDPTPPSSPRCARRARTPAHRHPRDRAAGHPKGSAWTPPRTAAHSPRRERLATGLTWGCQGWLNLPARMAARKASHSAVV